MLDTLASPCYSLNSSNIRIQKGPTSLLIEGAFCCVSYPLTRIDKDLQESKLYREGEKHTKTLATRSKMKRYLITTKAQKLEGTQNTSAYQMAVSARGKVEAKKLFKQMTKFTGRAFAHQI